MFQIELKDKMFDFNLQQTTKRLEQFIADACKKENYSEVLIGVSGGVDSATSLTLAVKSLGKEHIHPVLLPYGKLNNKGTKDAWLVIDELEIDHKQVSTIDIKPFVDTIVAADPTTEIMRTGNIMARMRMIVLYDLVKKCNALVVGTENKTEHLLGYYTRFGDEASDIEPLRNLYKTQVFMLAKHLGVPEKILTKQPTAGLWDKQTDEEEFGFSYKLVDEVLYLRENDHLTKKQLINKGYDEKTIERIWWWIDKGEFKSRLPYIAK